MVAIIKKWDLFSISGEKRIFFKLFNFYLNDLITFIVPQQFLKLSTNGCVCMEAEVLHEGNMKIKKNLSAK